MKLKMLVVLVLLGALLTSASVGTLSAFHSASTFSTSITVDTQAIKGKDVKQTDGQVESGQETMAAQPAAEQTQAAEPDQMSE